MGVIADLPLGAPIPDWQPPPHPPRDAVQGRYVRLEPIDIDRHARSLFDAFAGDDVGWAYLSYGPFETFADFVAWMRATCLDADPQFHALCDAEGRALGVASYLRIQSAAGSIEIGHLHFAPALQRTPATTEALSLLIARAFSLGYRRVEWKCNALNAASMAAARRLGLSYEGTFRQAMVSKGRNRDTAWFAIIDREWPAIAAAHARWLATDNFDAAGRQRQALSKLTAPLLHIPD